MQTRISCRFFQSFLLILVGSTFLFSQNQPPASDSQAVTLAQKSVAALTGGVSISDVALSGNAIWTTGPDTETGTATLSALGIGESRIDLALPSGTRTEIRDASTGTPLGKWVVPSGTSGKFVFHNCQTDAAWFYPALGSLAGGRNVVFSYIGQESRNGATVQHIRSYVYPSVQFIGATPNFQQLSTEDFYLDVTTFLPVALTFSAHPDSDTSRNILVEINFLDYQAVNGVTVPMHIQKYMGGTLLMDLTVSRAAFNTGIPSSTFSVN